MSWLGLILVKVRYWEVYKIGYNNNNNNNNNNNTSTEDQKNNGTLTALAEAYAKCT